MDPIHPIRPTAVNPAPVDPVRRVTRAGDDPAGERRRPRERRAPAAPVPASTAGVEPTGGLDVRA